MTTAIVVARGGSVRLPGKALLPFGDSTLIGHKVRTLRKCARIDRVVVGSDDPEILRAAMFEGAATVRRDPYFCDESVCSANEMIRDMVSKVEGDAIVWAHPTNPLISADTYDAAVRAYEAGLNTGHDSLVSVYPVRRHAWVDEHPANFDPMAKRHSPAAELPPIWFQDGGIFIQPRLQMLANGYFFGARPVLFETPADEVLDIDTERDYLAALSMQSQLSQCRPVNPA